MIHLDLFSGIGGFAYAIDQVWDGVEHIFCDNNKFCQAVLRKHWKGAKIYGDIREIVADSYRNRPQEQRAEIKAGGDRQLFKVGILTGGFPCQPFSQAGKRRGKDDDRYLWPEMLRIVRDFKPAWVVAENVRGLLTLQGGVVFEQVCVDLEGAGYEVQPFIIPACAVNAPHRRDRVWIVANRKSIIGKRGKSIGDRQGQSEMSLGDGDRDTHDTIIKGLEGHAETDKEPNNREGTVRPVATTDWGRNWLEVATCLCGVDDGSAVELDGLKLSKAGHRVGRLKALGNAIVPQVAVEIMKAIRYADESRLLKEVR
jgi:DNA (cytosine-5)-methyltransferase 1